LIRRRTAALADLPIATHLPLMANSDHANFAAHGIPAVRLIAGFNAPDSNLRLVLTAADTRDKVQPGQLDQALIWAKQAKSKSERQRRLTSENTSGS
jgi:aminopeptidase YwaD